MSDWQLHLIAIGAGVLVVYIIRQITYDQGFAAGYHAGHAAACRAAIVAERVATHNVVLTPSILQARHVARRTEAQRTKAPHWTRWRQQWQRKGDTR